MKKVVLWAFACAVVAASLAAPAQARLWSYTEIKTGSTPFDVGITPSLALLYGVQPVVSNYYQPGNPAASVVRLSPFGWTAYPIQPGYIAGVGADIRSYQNRLSCGRDGRFYSYLPNPVRPIALGDGEGPVWTGPTGPYMMVTADPQGRIVMAGGNMVKELQNGQWSSPVTVDFTITDLAVSPFGDVAIAGGVGGSGVVSWFDYKMGEWVRRSFGTKVMIGLDIEFDCKGNLGLAYVAAPQPNLVFDYLDIATGQWTSEVVNNALPSPIAFRGAALQFDRFDNPVIVSGSALFYDPVPEPSALMVLAMGISALGGVILRKR